MQIKVTKVSASDGGEQYEGKLFNLVFNLKCWNDGDDTKSVTPVIDKDFSTRYKVIPGVTTATKSITLSEPLQIEMQECIDKYKQENALLADPAIDALALDIQTKLKS